MWWLEKCAPGNQTRQAHPGQTGNEKSYTVSHLYYLAAVLSYGWESVRGEVRHMCFIRIVVVVDPEHGKIAHEMRNKPWMRYLSMWRHHAPRGNLEFPLESIFMHVFMQEGGRKPTRTWIEHAEHCMVTNSSSGSNGVCEGTALPSLSWS